MLLLGVKQHLKRGRMSAASLSKMDLGPPVDGPRRRTHATLVENGPKQDACVRERGSPL